MAIYSKSRYLSLSNLPIKHSKSRFWNIRYLTIHMLIWGDISKEKYIKGGITELLRPVSKNLSLYKARFYKYRSGLNIIEH